MIRLGLAVAGATLIVDQATKAYFYALLVEEGRRAIEVLPFFNLVTVWNYGISFGLFNTGSPYTAYLLIAIALAIVAEIHAFLHGLEGRPFSSTSA